MNRQPKTYRARKIEQTVLVSGSLGRGAAHRHDDRPANGSRLPRPRQASGSPAKSRLTLRYHPSPAIGRFHLPFMSFRAGSCAPSPPSTISFKCLSWALITSSAVEPWSSKSHGPPSWRHVITFIGLVSPLFVVTCLGWFAAA